MHLQASRESPAELVRDERLELACPRLPAEPARHENRLLLEWDAYALQLRDGGGECLLAGIADRARDRERRRLDDDRGPAAAKRQLLERPAGEREPERLANRRADVCERFGRRRRPEHPGIGRHVDDGQPRAGEERDSHYEGEDVGAGVVDEAVRLVQAVRLGPVMARLEGQDMATAAPALLGTGVQQRPGGSPPAEGFVHEQVRDPALRRRPVQPRLDPEADRARDLAVQLGDVHAAVRMLEVRIEHLALRLGVVGDCRPRELLHQPEDTVGVARLRLADDQGIDRYMRRNVGRKPRLGQNRDARRFVILQSIVMTR